VKDFESIFEAQFLPWSKSNLLQKQKTNRARNTEQ